MLVINVVLFLYERPHHNPYTVAIKKNLWAISKGPVTDETGNQYHFREREREKMFIYSILLKMGSEMFLHTSHRLPLFLSLFFYSSMESHSRR